MLQIVQGLPPGKVKSQNIDADVGGRTAAVGPKKNWCSSSLPAQEMVVVLSGGLGNRPISAASRIGPFDIGVLMRRARGSS